MPIRTLSKTVAIGVKDHHDPTEWYSFGKDREKVRDKGDVVACLQRAVILDPTNAQYWLSLGCNYEVEGKDWYGAVNAFNHTVFLNPRVAVAWFSLAYLWRVKGLYGKSADCYAQYRALGGQAPI